MHKPAVASWIILILTVVCYLVGTPPELMLWPLGSAEYRWWQPASYMLLHGSLLHLLVNLLALLSFGPALERAWGRGRFVACYVLAAILGGVMQAAVADAPVVGASAALFGLFAAYAVANPKRQLITLLPFPVPAWALLAIYVGLSILAMLTNWLAELAHAAHLGGVAVGLAFAYFVRVGKRYS